MCLTSSCSLQPLASQLLSSDYQSIGSRVPILFIGDSTDRFIQHDVCELGKMVGARADPLGYTKDETILQVCLSLSVVNLLSRKFAC